MTAATPNRRLPPAATNQHDGKPLAIAEQNRHRVQRQAASTTVPSRLAKIDSREDFSGIIG